VYRILDYSAYGVKKKQVDPKKNMPEVPPLFLAVFLRYRQGAGNMAFFPDSLNGN
jgi:hypothetical protein